MTHLFVITQGSISTNIAKMTPIIEACLPTPQDMYKKAKKATTVQEMNHMFPELIALTDASEQPILQPKRSDMPHYSGKAHTVKTQYTMSSDGVIVHKTAHSPVHDFKIYKMKHPTFPSNLLHTGEKNPYGRDHLYHYADTTYGIMGKVVPNLDYTLQA